MDPMAERCCDESGCCDDDSGCCDGGTLHAGGVRAIGRPAPVQFVAHTSACCDEPACCTDTLACCGLQCCMDVQRV